MSLTLTRTPLSPSLNATTNQHVWRLAGSIVSDEPGLPSEVFVYHVLPTGSDVDEVFECIASVPQWSEVGLVTVSAGDTLIPYYRRADFVLDCRSPEEADAVYVEIRTELKELLDNYRLSNSLASTVEEVIT